MHISEIFIEVIKHEGVAAIVTVAQNEAHIANTWNTYIRIVDNKSIIIPVGGMGITQENLEINPKVKMTVGTREVQGLRYMGTGFLVEGRGQVDESGANYDFIKKEFPWARAALVISPENITQTL
ncbi:MAG TPA: pyridoxamine 5'-phosphate oxidase family protein [Treponemataceae bacterium]|nr:pyridoxamine 5'-phosphate oxidase family protein [Treponemataceae bacterium]